MNIGFFMHILWFIYVRYGMLRYVALRRRYYDADAIFITSSWRSM